MTTKKTTQEQPTAPEQPSEHDLAADNIIKNHVIAASGLALVPIPIFDMAAMTATQMNMLRNLSEHYSVPFDDTSVKTIVAPMISGCLPVLGVIGLSSLVKLVPAIGTLAGSASLSITGGAITYAFGQVFARHCATGGSFEDFDSKQARRFIKEEFEQGKAFVRSMQDELNHNKVEKEADTQSEKDSDEKVKKGKGNAA